MLTKTITYVDFNENERTETAYFNLLKNFMMLFILVYLIILFQLLILL